MFALLQSTQKQMRPQAMSRKLMSPSCYLVGILTVISTGKLNLECHLLFPVCLYRTPCAYMLSISVPSQLAHVVTCMLFISSKSLL